MFAIQNSDVHFRESGYTYNPSWSFIEQNWMKVISESCDNYHEYMDKDSGNLEWGREILRDLKKRHISKKELVELGHLFGDMSTCSQRWL